MRYVGALLFCIIGWNQLCVPHPHHTFSYIAHSYGNSACNKQKKAAYEVMSHKEQLATVCSLYASCLPLLKSIELSDSQVLLLSELHFIEGSDSLLAHIDRTQTKLGFIMLAHTLINTVVNHTSDNGLLNDELVCFLKSNPYVHTQCQALLRQLATNEESFLSLYRSSYAVADLFGATDSLSGAVALCLPRSMLSGFNQELIILLRRAIKAVSIGVPLACVLNAAFFDNRPLATLLLWSIALSATWRAQHMHQAEKSMLLSLQPKAHKVSQFVMTLEKLYVLSQNYPALTRFIPELYVAQTVYAPKSQYWHGLSQISMYAEQQNASHKPGTTYALLAVCEQLKKHLMPLLIALGKLDAACSLTQYAQEGQSAF